MALSIHGNVIIASEIISKYASEYTTSLRFLVASDNGDQMTTRYTLQLSVENSRVADIEQKIQVGRICEIVNGTLIDTQNTVNSNEKNPLYNHTRLYLKTKREYFKFLVPCIYYENMKNITKSE